MEYKTKPDKSIEIFDIMHPLVKEWFINKFKNFSEPQKYGIMEIHNRKNVLISAQTGTGKTLCSTMAILNELVYLSESKEIENKVYCIYINPLKALSNDIEVNLKKPLEEIEKISGKKLGIRIAVRTGDTSSYEKAKMNKESPHILVCTPETLAIVLSSKKFREKLEDVKYCIIDEIHSLAENKRGVHLSLSLERLENLCGYMTRIGLSATVQPLGEIAKYLAGNGRECKIVNVRLIKKTDMKIICPVEDMINVSYEKIQDEMYKTIHDLIQLHKTTLIFTNTRAGTERIVHKLKKKYPKYYGKNIGAHHGSLSKEYRTKTEGRLRKGELKCAVSSTSLELGIDIGSVDLVICLGSPKSIARFLQRAGRSNHQLEGCTKSRIIVLDRDDLVECALLLKSAIEHKIDNIQIPKNSLDVLAQQIFGMCLEKVWNEKEMFDVIRRSYCYSELSKEDFEEVLSYLAGEFASLEERYIYSKIWRDNSMIGKRGKLARLIYMTNIGTIPDQSSITVKCNGEPIGTIDEAFLEKLEKNDRFVLGGDTYTFRHARGMVANVSVSDDKHPTVPSWFSEMLPLSFDLAMEINKFRRLILDKIEHKLSKEEILNFINNYLYVDENSSEAIYRYFLEQYAYTKTIPSDKRIVMENYIDEYGKKKVIFHTLFGRRVNDVLSRAIAYTISKTQKKAVSVGINDNGFYLGTGKGVNVLKALKELKNNELREVMNNAVNSSEVLRRRFRHCAGRALMILRNYKGKKKRAGKQQVNSMKLLKTVREISEDFAVLKEARREVLEDQMDIINASNVMANINKNEIKLDNIDTKIPSPFAFNIAMQGISDIIKLEEKQEFLQRMHKMILAHISLEKKFDVKKIVYNRLG